MTTDSMFALTGKVAVVTGGNGGIGLAMAAALAEAGARVMLAARNPDKGAEAVRHIVDRGGDARFVPADLSEPEAASGCIAAVAADEGRLDILVNNAGITARKRPEDLDIAEWEAVLRTNLTAAFACAKAAYPALKASGAGRILNIGSMYSLFGAPFASAYGASKGGIVQLTRSLATAWAADGITVNAVLPGWIATDMGVSARSQVQGLHERIVARTPAGRWGEATDLAGLAVFLAGPSAAFITGASIPVDGGYSIA
ncbi:2-deoxy-D-gluconate 3-dehydrogenase [Pseudoxanthobacter soli DSM 19599]|uniref:2-deoxy-D-gluconate 3-dehydrogenase n=1 Tax=Pseudoxanthobacter soli DSM 19599 TaxID=1123029 RepID=A0A1M7ZNY6_9HYPH|nr:SDR family oxidoreductase [Pseudoxanthobacter soli]SHO66529.1 2-deoxy-D-gluconate 3-dehydrogenase [Pseudoxanthobacter soli DSM 19599]